MLGKIREVSLGFGGYQDCQFGLTITFDFSDGSSCATFIFGGYKNEINSPDSMAYLSIDICKLLEKAKVNDLNGLKGKPVEATFSNMVLKSWRILEEVL